MKGEEMKGEEMKVFFMLFIIVIFSISSVTGHALGDLAASMQPGEWAELTGTSWSRTLDNTDCLGGTGSTDATDWSDNLCYDPIHEEVMYLGAGHLRVHQFLRYRASNNTWFSFCSGIPSCMLVGGYSGCFTHGYDIQAIDPATGIFYYHAGGKIFAFNVGTQNWSENSISGSAPGGYGSVLENFPPAGKLVKVNGGTVSMGNKNGSGWAVVASGLEMGAYHNLGTYSARQRRLYFGGGNGSSAVWYMDSSLTPVQCEDGPGSTIHVSYTTFTSDPVTGEILLIATDDKLYALDPYTLTWAEMAQSVPPQTSHALATPIDNYGVTLFAFVDPYKVYLYKHAGPNDTLDIIGLEAQTADPSIEQFLSTQLSVIVTYSGGAKDTTTRAGYAALDPGVATVSSAGVVTGVSVGTARIQVQKKTTFDTISIQIVASTAVTDSIRVSLDSMKILATESYSIHVTGYFHKDAQTFERNLDDDATWTSADEGIATVTGGNVTGVSAGGPAAIAAEYNGKSDTCLFTIWPKPAFIKRINFQVTSTPFSHGWYADNGKTYDAGIGHGWVNPSGLSTRDDRGGDNFLLKSFVGTSDRTAFFLDVPDGEYIIKAAMGDNNYGGNDTLWHGSDVIMMHEGSSNQTVVDTLTVSGGGGLSLVVNGKINYLVVISNEGIDINEVADDGGVSVPPVIEEDPPIAADGPVMKVCPNPFSRRVAIQFKGQGSKFKVQIFNINGKVVKKLMANSQQLKAGITWNPSNHPAGIYIIRCRIGTRTIERKISLIK